MCGCIDLVDAKLKERNTALDVAISLAGAPLRVYVGTHVAEKRRGAKAALLIAAFCPFCGERYPTEAPAG